jgi:hypothetical protein
MPSVNLRQYTSLNNEQGSAITRIMDTQRIIDLVRLNLRIYIEYRKAAYVALAQQELNLKNVYTKALVCFEIESCLDYIFNKLNLKMQSLHPNLSMYECFYYIRIKLHHHRKQQML